MKSFFATAATVAALTFSHAFAQTTCRGTSVAGTIRDSTLALIPGATITLDGNQNEESGSDGSFHFLCIASGPHHLTAAAQGFAESTLSLTTPHNGPVVFTLKPEAVEIQMDVDADNGAATSTNSSGPSQTISGKRLQSLADDPDDLLRELQQMAATAGGSPSSATISIDGFQGGDGNTTLPPKSSIA